MRCTPCLGTGVIDEKPCDECDGYGYSGRRAFTEVELERVLKGLWLETMPAAGRA